MRGKGTTQGATFLDVMPFDHFLSEHIKNTHLIGGRNITEQSKFRELVHETLRAVRAVHKIILTQVRSALRAILNALCNGFAKPSHGGKARHDLSALRDREVFRFCLINIERCEFNASCIHFFTDLHITEADGFRIRWMWNLHVLIDIVAKFIHATTHLIIIETICADTIVGGIVLDRIKDLTVGNMYLIFLQASIYHCGTP